MKYAIVKIGGKQFKIEEGQKFDVESQNGLNFEVLYYTDGKEILIGEPILTDVKINAEIVEDKRDRKVRIARFKSKSRYRRVQGHRQPISVIEVKSITKGSEKKVESKESKPAKEEKTEKKAVKSETKKVKSSKKDN